MHWLAHQVRDRSKLVAWFELMHAAVAKPCQDPFPALCNIGCQCLSMQQHGGVAVQSRSWKLAHNHNHKHNAIAHFSMLAATHSPPSHVPPCVTTRC
jgi:hypothetical protein